MSDTADTSHGSTADEMIDYKKIHDQSIQGDGSGDPDADREFVQDLPPAQVGGDGAAEPDHPAES